MSGTITDLNVIHEMESLIYETEETAELYEDILMDVIVQQFGYQGAYTIVHATAGQRHAALLIYMAK